MNAANWRQAGIFNDHILIRASLLRPKTQYALNVAGDYPKNDKPYHNNDNNGRSAPNHQVAPLSFLFHLFPTSLPVYFSGFSTHSFFFPPTIFNRSPACVWINYSILK
jgi:hypothetical protein